MIGGAVGNAASVGGLSVPAAWASAAPTAPSVAVALNGAASAGAIERATNAVGGVPMVPAGVGRSAGAHFVTPRYGFKPTVIAQPPAGG
ncbi:PE/PPE C-terminal domain-containing protein [Mycobacterium colombiense]